MSQTQACHEGQQATDFVPRHLIGERVPLVRGPGLVVVATALVRSVSLAFAVRPLPLLAAVVRLEPSGWICLHLLRERPNNSLTICAGVAMV